MRSALSIAALLVLFGCTSKASEPKPASDLGSPGLSAGPERELARPPGNERLPDELRPPR